MSVKTEEKSYAERQALRYTKNYTNEHICKQISENSTMFSIILGMLIVALVIIILCFIKGFYIAGLVIGITDHYDEWDTYCVKIKTRNHRRLVLTEVAYKGDTDRLMQIL